MFSSSFLQRKEEILLKFNDIVFNFQETLDKIINEQDSKVSKEFSVMGGNLFRGILEEFQKSKLVHSHLYNISVSQK